MTEENSVVNFRSGIVPIRLDYKYAKVYQKCIKYDIRNMGSPKTWHQIIILHKGQLKQSNADRLIIDALYAVVDNSEFYPVAYIKGPLSDKFLVRNCKEAIDKLFANGLAIKIYKGPTFNLKVLLSIAVYQFGQIDPLSLVSRVVFKKVEQLESHKGIDGVLNLSQFGENVEFQHVIVNLGNTAVFEQVCEFIAKNNECFRNLNGILLRHNYIQSVKPLHVFRGIHLQLIDLSNNCIKKITTFCNDIRQMTAHELLLAGNPINSHPKYIEYIEQYNLKANFKVLDGTPLQTLLGSNDKIITCKNSSNTGYRIDRSNKKEIIRFADTNHDWHAILIPDETNEFTKETIFDNFYRLLSPDLSDVYPCYYRHDGRAHYFMVQNCFDQLLYLAENSDFVLSISNVDECDDGQDQRPIKKRFYMLMAVSAFQTGQVQPLICIEQALSKRFVLLNRLLDLSNFQNSPGLENVNINMSSTNALNVILNIAGRKFMDNCFELNLSDNKITNLNNPNLVVLFRKLERLDLSNNRLANLDCIKQLHMLSIKTLKLTGNPLCRKYPLPHVYANAVQSIFTSLVKLDDVELKYNPSYLTQKNYLCHMSGYEFVDRFIRQYFNTYEEQSQRKQLTGFYADNALFSMSCGYRFQMKPAKDLLHRVNLYRAYSRNILSSESKLDGYVVGSDEIVSVLMKFPAVKHDFESFQIDVPHCDLNGRIVIYVSGLFEEHSTAVDKGLLLAFSRRFILMCAKRNEGSLMDGSQYLIFNECFSITNPTKSQYKNAFKYNPQSDIQDDALDDNSAETRKTLILILHETTGLNTMWCYRILEDCHWKYEQTLARFLQLVKSNEIPKSAWKQSDLKQQSVPIENENSKN